MKCTIEEIELNEDGLCFDSIFRLSGNEEMCLILGNEKLTIISIGDRKKEIFSVTYLEPVYNVITYGNKCIIESGEGANKKITFNFETGKNTKDQINYGGIFNKGLDISAQPY